MSRDQHSVLVEQVETALRSPAGLSLELRSQVLRLPRGARKEAGMKLAIFSLGLLSEHPVRWCQAIVPVGGLLDQMKVSLWTQGGDSFERGPQRS